MIPAVPFVLSAVLAATEEGGDDDLSLIRKLFLLERYPEAFRELARRGRLDLVIEACERMSKRVKRPASRGFTAVHTLTFAYGGSAEEILAAGLMKVNDEVDRIIERVWENASDSDDSFALLLSSAKHPSYSNFRMVNSSSFQVDVTYDDTKEALNERLVSCGLNSDWSSSAWWVGPYGKRPNRTFGDLYILDLETDDDSYLLVQRVDYGDSDEVLDIVKGHSREIYEAAMAVKEALKRDKSLRYDSNTKMKRVNSIATRLQEIAKAAMAKVQ